MRILTKLYGSKYSIKTQLQEIRLLATIGFILSYISDINQYNKARKRNWLLGLIGHLGIAVYVNNVLEYLGRSLRNKHTSPLERKGHSKTEAERD